MIVSLSMFAAMVLSITSRLPIGAQGVSFVWNWSPVNQIIIIIVVVVIIIIIIIIIIISLTWKGTAQYNAELYNVRRGK